MPDIDEIKKNLETGKLVIGTNNTLNNIKLGNIQKVFITKNCSDDVRKDLDNYNKVEKIEIIQLDIANDELGSICKKPFSISVIGLLKG
ncbi:MAG: ribosomal L7Ae/L30e/S12e/Gadd45 family protein [Candidatus Woesearchaeota archaeon]